MNRKVLEDMTKIIRRTRQFYHLMRKILQKFDTQPSLPHNLSCYSGNGFCFVAQLKTLGMEK
jgi:hypothetical protein